MRNIKSPPPRPRPRRRVVFGSAGTDCRTIQRPYASRCAGPSAATYLDTVAVRALQGLGGHKVDTKHLDNAAVRYSRGRRPPPPPPPESGFHMMALPGDIVESNSSARGSFECEHTPAARPTAGTRMRRRGAPAPAAARRSSCLGRGGAGGGRTPRNKQLGRPCFAQGLSAHTCYNHVNVAAAAPHNPVSRSPMCRFPPGMRSIHPYTQKVAWRVSYRHGLPAPRPLPPACGCPP